MDPPSGRIRPRRNATRHDASSRRLPPIHARMPGRFQWTARRSLSWRVPPPSVWLPVSARPRVGRGAVRFGSCGRRGGGCRRRCPHDLRWQHLERGSSGHGTAQKVLHRGSRRETLASTWALDASAWPPPVATPPPCRHGKRVAANPRLTDRIEVVRSGRVWDRPGAARGLRHLLVGTCESGGRDGHRGETGPQVGAVAGAEGGLERIGLATRRRDVAPGWGDPAVPSACEATPPRRRRPMDARSGRA